VAISVQLLREQVTSTAPWLKAPWVDWTRDYYGVCLTAHFATCGTFVPTDVDNAIRWKLWQDASPEEKNKWADLVLEALKWDYAPVTARIVTTKSGLRVSTHEGTWFSIAVGAYGATKRPDILKAMKDEAEREITLWKELRKAKDGLNLLKASALIAHNFGDLDRVADQWKLSLPGLYDIAKPGVGVLGEAGALNQKFMTADNHRHYPLRAAKSLRQHAALLLPIGPFFDDWGFKVGKTLTAFEAGEVGRALVDGWTRMHEPPGYGRALAGLLKGQPSLRRVLPSKDAKSLDSGPLKVALDVPQEAFESRLAAAALKLLA
jgi:hypothetical protein